MGILKLNVSALVCVCQASIYRPEPALQHGLLVYTCVKQRLYSPIKVSFSGLGDDYITVKYMIIYVSSEQLHKEYQTNIQTTSALV